MTSPKIVRGVAPKRPVCDLRASQSHAIRHHTIQSDGSQQQSAAAKPASTYPHDRCCHRVSSISDSIDFIVDAGFAINRDHRLADALFEACGRSLKSDGHVGALEFPLRGGIVSPYRPPPHPFIRTLPTTPTTRDQGSAIRWCCDELVPMGYDLERKTCGALAKDDHLLRFALILIIEGAPLSSGIPMASK